MIRAARKDSNHKEVVSAMEKIGASVIDLWQVKNAFDVLALYRGKAFIIEIKDGAKPPSARKLTEGEIKCKNKVERAGVDYHIIKSVQEAIDLITK
tara:strand:+ start:53 stop:340 length:288 start_codon:yes stop_codon:yes gene_type:complete